VALIGCWDQVYVTKVCLVGLSRRVGPGMGCRRFEYDAGSVDRVIGPGIYLCDPVWGA